MNENYNTSEFEYNFYANITGPSAQKKTFFIYAPILMGFFSSEVKFNFKTLLFLVKFFIFLIYKKLQLFF